MPDDFSDTFVLNGGHQIRQQDIGEYLIDFCEGNDILVITFENREDQRVGSRRPPWGFHFLRKRGFSILGIKAKKTDWYRGATLHAFFRSEALRERLRGYRRVVFYGSSMGGYGALTFATPGAIVIAHNPQTTLDERLVPWERRYADGRRQDWDGDFADAAEGARQAHLAYVTYDPFFEPDRRQVDRLQGPNIRLLKAPMLGHGLPVPLNNMGLLSVILDRAAQDELTVAEWGRLIRRRRELPRYFVGFALATRHRGVAQWCMDRALAFDTLPPIIFHQLYQAAWRHHLWDRALDAVRRSEEVEGLSARSHERRARVLLQQKEIGAALDAVEAALLLRPGAVDLSYLRGLILIAAGRRAEAAALAAEIHALPAGQLHGERLLELARRDTEAA